MSGLVFSQLFMDSSNFEGSFSQKTFTFIGIILLPFYLLLISHFNYFEQFKLFKLILLCHPLAQRSLMVS
jgi:hypothetical protein